MRRGGGRGGGVKYFNSPLYAITSTSTVKFFCTWCPTAKTVYFPACFLLEWAGRATACPSLYQVTNGLGFPPTSQLKVSPSLTCSFVGHSSCGPTAWKVTTEREWRHPSLKEVCWGVRLRSKVQCGVLDLVSGFYIGQNLTHCPSIQYYPEH